MSLISLLKGSPLALGLALALAQPSVAQTPLPKTLSENAADLTAGRTTSVALVQAYLARIAAIDDAGPAIRAVIVTNPDVIAQAQALDAERAAGRVRGLLHGIPILLKDNIESADAMATTAGSLALRNNVTRRDAPMVARLRAAGAIILGKTNLSEWANFRGNNSTSGYSLTGGLTRNPYLLTHNACGSSSGSGAGMAARLAPKPTARSYAPPRSTALSASNRPSAWSRAAESYRSAAARIQQGQ